MFYGKLIPVGYQTSVQYTHQSGLKWLVDLVFNRYRQTEGNEVTNLEHVTFVIVFLSQNINNTLHFWPLLTFMV